jgi:tRNA(Met) C34 N-acetyltransferase TmcA
VKSACFWIKYSFLIVAITYNQNNHKYHCYQIFVISLAKSITVGYYCFGFTSNINHSLPKKTTGLYLNLSTEQLSFSGAPTRYPLDTSFGAHFRRERLTRHLSNYVLHCSASSHPCKSHAAAAKDNRNLLNMNKFNTKRMAHSMQRCCFIYYTGTNFSDCLASTP